MKRIEYSVWSLPPPSNMAKNSKAITLFFLNFTSSQSLFTSTGPSSIDDSFWMKQITIQSHCITFTRVCKHSALILRSPKSFYSSVDICTWKISISQQLNGYFLEFVTDDDFFYVHLTTSLLIRFVYLFTLIKCVSSACNQRRDFFTFGCINRI